MYSPKYQPKGQLNEPNDLGSSATQTIPKVSEKPTDFFSGTGLYPVTWYQVAWSHEVPIKGIKSVTLCGSQLVIFRGEDGKVSALDAHCPHLGAHLGVRGKVCGNQIKCGFHSWQFDGSGTCRKLSSDSKITSKMHTKAWRVAERYGIIFVHYDPQGVALQEEFPVISVLETGKWGRAVGKEHAIQTRQADVLENGVDMEHFNSVHGVPMNNARLSEDTNGNLLFQHQTVTSKLGIQFNTAMEIRYYIPGLQTIHLGSVLGRECLAISSVTPKGPDSVVAHLTVQLRAGGFLPWASWTPWTLWTQLLTRVIAYFINSTFAEDIPIWNAKIYKNKPVLARGDEGISRFRQWYSRFPGTC